MSYRVWRLNTGDGTWAELTASARVNDPTRTITDDTVLTNHLYRYYVQAEIQAMALMDGVRSALPKTRSSSQTRPR